jgi:ABC-type polysaccharide/polyol phosphate transport system ATPase subunit
MSRSDDEVLVKVEGVSKKFCRSLKKSLWYGVCDIAGELLPGRKRESQRTDSGLLRADGTTKHTKLHEMGTAGGNQLADSGEFLEGHSQAGLQMDSEKLAAIRSANDPGGSSGHSNILKNVRVNAVGLEGDGSGLDGEAAAGEHSVILKNVSINSDGVAGASAAPALDSGLSSLDSAHGLRDGEFWAVRDVSFELRRGECLGLIGHNGAGKTTLLKMLNGLIKPDAGSITMRGRVGALIALGAGFNPILTGRENIYINGSVLGLTKKEIDAKIDEIIDFAEIREFIDTPVQSYSSGMTVRLGFAVATKLAFGFLVVNEVVLA